MTTEPHEEYLEEAVGEDDEEELSWPFGFIAVLVLAALYLMWRLIDLAIRFFQWAF